MEIRMNSLIKRQTTGVYRDIVEVFQKTELVLMRTQRSTFLMNGFARRTLANPLSAEKQIRLNWLLWSYANTIMWDFSFAAEKSKATL